LGGSPKVAKQDAATKARLPGCEWQSREKRDYKSIKHSSCLILRKSNYAISAIAFEPTWTNDGSLQQHELWVLPEQPV